MATSQTAHNPFNPCNPFGFKRKRILQSQLFPLKSLDFHSCCGPQSASLYLLELGLAMKVFLTWRASKRSKVPQNSKSTLMRRHDLLICNRFTRAKPKPPDSIVSYSLTSIGLCLLSFVPCLAAKLDQEDPRSANIVLYARVCSVCTVCMALCDVRVVDLSCFACVCVCVQGVPHGQLVLETHRYFSNAQTHARSMSGWSLFSGFQGQGSVFDYVGVSLNKCGKEVLPRNL